MPQQLPPWLEEMHVPDVQHTGTWTGAGSHLFDVVMYAARFSAHSSLQKCLSF